MEFFLFRNNGTDEKQWTYAVSIRSTSHLVEWYCEGCGRAATYPSRGFRATLEGGHEFPDFLECGAYPLLVVSQRALSILEEAGITCFQKCAIDVAAIQDSPLRREDAPAYFRIETSGECMVDFQASGITISSICYRCGEVTREPPLIEAFKIVEGSWDGSELFRDHRYFPRVHFVTRKVVDLAKKHRLTNCRFEQMP
jgi:hypothetical protein